VRVTDQTGAPVQGCQVIAFYADDRYVDGLTNPHGVARLELETLDLPLAVYCVALGYENGCKQRWLPCDGDLVVELVGLAGGGSLAFLNGTGYLPGLKGRLNPILDDLDRLYMYADNIAIDGGKRQPAYFDLERDIRVRDAAGQELVVQVIDIRNRTSILQWRELRPDEPSWLDNQLAEHKELLAQLATV